jgi:hypothetical protein
MEKKIYVVRSGEGWAVKHEGKQSPVAVYPQKEEAVKRGTAEARQHETDLVIEDDQGKSETIKFDNKPAV